MNALLRLARELKQLAEIFDPPDLLRYLGHVIIKAPAILQKRSLVPADVMMTRVVRVHHSKKTIRVPVGEITSLLGYRIWRRPSAEYVKCTQATFIRRILE